MIANRILLAALLFACVGAGAAQFTVAPGGTVTMPGGSLALGCADFAVQGTMSLGASQVTGAGTVSIPGGGSLDAGSSSITVGGNWANAGTFAAGTGTVTFADGCTSAPAAFTGTTAFRNLSLTSASGRGFILPVGALVSVSGALSLAGTAAQPLQVSSATPGQAATVVMGAAGSISRSFASFASGAAIDATAFPRLANISTRMQVLTGNDVLIGGFIIGGTESKTVVVRARGPSLVPFGVANAVANPRMDLFSGQAVIASSDDWGGNANAAAVQASGFAPSNALESAILTTLAPGAYTAVVSGVGNATGVGIIEVFEVDKPEAPLANISTRGQVLTGGDVMIGGFIIQGSAPKTVVVRARGPSLVPFGIANALQDPVLQLFAGQAVIASNDDWQAQAVPGDVTAIQASGFAPADTREAVIRVTLQPGAYTAIVTGKNGGVGVGIVEVFAQ